MLNLKDIEGRDFDVNSNIHLVCRERGKIVRGTRRVGHNVFTVTGRNWLSKLVAFNTIIPPGARDFSYTQKRVRWIGVGAGTQFEVTTVTQLANPLQVTSGNYLVTVPFVEFPTSQSVRFIKEFGTTEISFGGSTVGVSEAALYADVNTADLAGDEDVAAVGEDTTLDPNLGTNPPIAYKSFEEIPKNEDFTLEVRWEFRF